MTEDKVSDQVNAVANLAKAVPVYDDALKPIMKETGKALGTVGKAVNVALAPIKGFVWGYEQVEAWLENNVATKLNGIPEDQIGTPDLSVAGPAIEALKFNGHKPELSEMFAGLLAGAMKSETKAKAHPSYVNFIKEMSVLDAKIFAEVATSAAVPTVDVDQITEGINGKSSIRKFYSAKFDHLANAIGLPPKGRLNMIQSSVENLDRMGLIAATTGRHLTSPIHKQAYEELLNGSLKEEFDRVSDETHKFELSKSSVVLTAFGKDFSEVVF